MGKANINFCTHNYLFLFLLPFNRVLRKHELQLLVWAFVSERLLRTPTALRLLREAKEFLSGTEEIDAVGAQS